MAEDAKHVWNDQDKYVSKKALKENGIIWIEMIMYLWSLTSIHE